MNQSMHFNPLRFFSIEVCIYIFFPLKYSWMYCRVHQIKP